MDAERINISNGYCPLFLARGMSLDDCQHGDPTDYETCQTYQERERTNELWENRIAVFDEYGKKRL